MKFQLAQTKERGAWVEEREMDMAKLVAVGTRVRERDPVIPCGPDSKAGRCHCFANCLNADLTELDSKALARS